MNDFVLYLRRAVLLVFCAVACGESLCARKPVSYLTDSIPRRWTPDTMFLQALPTDDRWWRDLNDPCLDSLISLAVRNNYDVLVAANRIRVAKAALRMQQSEYYPSLDFSAGWTKSRASGNLTGSTQPNSETQYASGDLSMSWEIDLFGSVRQRAKAKKELYRASREEYYGAMVALCAQVATTYTMLRTYQQQYVAAEGHINSQKAVMQIVEARYKAGLVSQLDVAQSRTVYYNTLASLALLEGSIQQQMNILAVLSGLYPHQLQPVLEVPRPLPEYLRLVSVGVPMNLVRRRPDIRQAERTIASYAAMAGASRSDFLPKLQINGSIGFAARDMDRLFREESLTYQIAPVLTWSIFQGTSRFQALSSAKAEVEIAIEQYNQTVLTAMQEVENAMTAYTHSIRQIQTLEKLLEEANRVLTLAIDLYKRGLTDYQTVLDSQRSVFTYQNTFVAAQGTTLRNLILLYEALGGGWDAAMEN